MSVNFRSSIGFGIYFAPGEFSAAWHPIPTDESDEINEIIDDFVYDLNPYSDKDTCGYFFGIICRSLDSDSRPAAIDFTEIAVPHEEYDRAVKAYEKCFPELAAEATPCFKFHFFSRWC